MKFILPLILATLVISSCTRTSEAPVVTPTPEVTSEMTESVVETPPESLPAPVDMSVPLVDELGNVSCPPGLILMSDTTPARCEYDNRPL